MGPGSGDGPDEMRARRERDVAALLSQISYLEEEIGLLRRKVADSPRQVRALEERIAEAEGRAAFLSERNDKLAGTLRDAREQLVTLKEEVDRLGQPPSGYGVFLTGYDDGTVDVFTGGRKLRVSVSPNVEVDELRHRPGGHAQRGDERRRGARRSSAPATSSCSRSCWSRSTASRRGPWSSGTPTRSGWSSSPTR